MSPRKFALAAPLLGLALIASGCSSAPGSAAAESSNQIQSAAIEVPTVQAGRQQVPVSFTGDDKAGIKINSLERVVVLDDATLEIAHALGVGASVYATPNISVLEDLAAQAPVRLLTNAGALTVEGLVALEPSLLIGSNMRRHADLSVGLRKIGVPATLIDASQPAPEKIRKTAQALGVGATGEELATAVEAQIKKVSAAASAIPNAERPRVMVLSSSGAGDSGQTTAAGKSTPAHEMITSAGAINTGAETGLDRYQSITAEGLVAAKPDVIVVAASEIDDLGGAEGIWKKIPGLSGVPAAANHKLIVIEDELIKHSGVSTGKAVQTLQSALFPEL